MIRESFSIGVLNLPNYGEIILSDNLIIGVDPAISGCSDTEPVQWSSIPDSWFEPANWKNSDLRNREFTRDEESVPCQNSRVILPQETTFMISSESSLLAETTSIQPWGSALTSSSTLAQYKATDWGRYQIPQLEVDFAQQFCDSTGCLCHKSQYQSSLMATICASKTCPELQCQDGFIPSGHCCPICGAQIHLDYNNDFNFDQFEKFVDEQVNGDLNIKYKAYKVAKNTLTRGEVELEILVVLTDSDDTDVSFIKCEIVTLDKTGWPSGLRRQIKALVSSGAWVRIPLQSNFLLSELCENGSEKAVEGSKVISGRGRLHSGLLRQRPWHDWGRRFWYYLCGSSHPPRARFCVYKTRLSTYILHHQVPTHHLLSA